jgi:cytoskeletal protein RodZ
VTDPEQTAGGGLVAFGRHLVRERELRGLTRDDVVRATRLPASAIEAIEVGDPDRTPHRAYVVVYLRGYAAAVGLDPDEVVLRFEEASGPRSDAPSARTRLPLPVVALLVLGVAALAFGLLWTLRHGW